MKNLDAQRLLAESGLDYFKGASTFGALSDDAIRFLLENGQVQCVEAGETIFRSGEPGSFFAVVLQGKLGYYREVEQERLLIREIHFGEEVGYVSMIGLFNRKGSVYALESSTVLKVDSNLFFQLHLDFPSDFGILMLNLSRELARTIDGINNKLTAIATGHGRE
ncbi:hypothetical protein GCM10011352_09960 [Marinobacterium zhoushanense]|uniref:Cyclic nucleotide-binding domain-containing protein n=1 Tax=Marinobacterium zhoushanense TaxID=1679163 RepID=A0ABQ1K5H7_9GAMM|nr:Crp/Fnr family transcriptional regulator [Marinobacterium zhoushanense]GGB86086.1 hypothetical protein GCM10011352_09960 [Marinobacterium zhoushanense]